MTKKCRLSLAIPKNEDYTDITYFNNKKVATSYPNILSKYFKENNIELDEKTLENMSNYIADNYGDVGEITDEDVNRAILSYYSAYADALTGGELPEELPEIPAE